MEQQAVLIEPNQKISDFTAALPTNVQGVFAKAYSGKSKAAALKAKCIDCMGCEDYRNRISACQTNLCPLWSYRPYQKGSADDDSEAK